MTNTESELTESRIHSLELEVMELKRRLDELSKYLTPVILSNMPIGGGRVIENTKLFTIDQNHTTKGNNG